MFALLLLSCGEEAETTYELQPPTQDSVTTQLIDEGWKTVVLPEDAELIAMHREPCMKLIYQVMSCIKSNDYDTWYGLLSDSTIAITPDAQLKQRLNRLHEYGIEWEWIKVAQLVSFQDSTIREDGTLYHVMVNLPEGAQIMQRVGFDPLRVSDDPNAELMMGFDIVEKDDQFNLFQHKYVQGANGEQFN